ncbi:MAG: zinc-ribbon domain-containing protein [Xanthomonadales bacterium]|nr:zinc-ribbon domain-containing protein [Xanthomonadales bacterium]
MFARCPQCKTVHALKAAQLSHARGLVQCGQCGRTFSALSFLFDEWPAGQAYQPAKDTSAGAPVLGATRPTSKPEQVTENDAADNTANRSGVLAWGLATSLLVLLTLANTAWTFRDSLAQSPVIGGWLRESGWLQTDTDTLLQDQGQFQLVSRDMHAHPTRSGILVLSITFVNLAPRNQAYPVLEVTLLDAVNQAVARRRLQAVDYLRPGADIDAGLAPDVYLPVLLEFSDPGMQAVGFEIRFL